ncbi:MAG: hypothetical protein WDW36_007441 [Sanguina aurantia]
MSIAGECCHELLYRPHPLPASLHHTAPDPGPVGPGTSLAPDPSSHLDPGPADTDRSAPRSRSCQRPPGPVAPPPPPPPPPALAELDASDPCGMLAPFLNALSELEGPRHAARAAADPAWTAAYAQALNEVIGGSEGGCLRLRSCTENPVPCRTSRAHRTATSNHQQRRRGAVRVLILGHGGSSALLALLAVAAGAGSVTCVEKDQTAYRAAHGVLQDNAHTAGWARISLSPVPLQRCYAAPPSEEDEAVGQEGARHKIPTDGDSHNIGAPVGLLVADLCDHRWVSEFRVSAFRVSEFRVSEFGVSEFRVSEFRVTEFKVSEFRLSEFRVSEFRVSEFRVSEFRVSEFRVSGFKVSEFRISEFEVSDFRVSEFRISVFRVVGHRLGMPDGNRNRSNATTALRPRRHVYKPSARVIPERLRVRAVLGELLVNDVDGFDLSPMNAYRWHPSHQPVQLDRQPVKELSLPVQLLDIAVTALLQCNSGRTDEVTAQVHLSRSQVEVCVSQTGKWNSIAYWTELHLTPAVTMTSYSHTPRNCQLPNTEPGLSGPASLPASLRVSDGPGVSVAVPDARAVAGAASAGTATAAAAARVAVQGPSGGEACDRPRNRVYMTGGELMPQALCLFGMRPVRQGHTTGNAAESMRPPSRKPFS